MLRIWEANWESVPSSSDKERVCRPKFIFSGFFRSIASITGCSGLSAGGETRSPRIFFVGGRKVRVDRFPDLAI